MKFTSLMIRNSAVVGTALAIGIAAGRVSTADDSSSMDKGLGARHQISVGIAQAGDSVLTPQSRSDRRASPSNAAAVFTTQDQAGRIQALLALLDDLNAEGTRQLVEQMEKDGLDAAFRDEYLLVLGKWAARDPLSAATHTRDHHSDSDARDAVMSAWATWDPLAAEDWARQAHDSDEANPWLVGVIQGIAGSDADAARSLIEELPRGRERRTAMESALGHVLLQGSDAASEWLNGMSDPKLQSDGAKWLAEKLGARDPEKAAAWVSSIKSPDARSAAAEEVAVVFARHDMAAAQSWVLSLPDDARLSAAEGLVDQLAKQDPALAFHWVDQLGEGEQLDDMRRDIVKRGFEQDPQAAMTTALHLSEERTRERFTSRYLERWFETDPTSASGWMQTHAEFLPASVRDRFSNSQSPINSQP